MTAELIKALKHVQSVYPQVCMVVFAKDSRWHYMDEVFNAPVFDNRIDISLLEEAADSIETLPFIYQE
jgi:hypothetical protein